MRQVQALNLAFDFNHHASLNDLIAPIMNETLTAHMNTFFLHYDDTSPLSSPIRAAQETIPYKWGFYMPKLRGRGSLLLHIPSRSLTEITFHNINSMSSRLSQYSPPTSSQGSRLPSCKLVFIGTNI